MDIIEQIIQWFMDNINYGTIILLMSIESSLIPFPSEIVIPPAAWKAASGQLNVVLVVLSGLLGSILGALFNYVLARTLGSRLIYAFARTRIAHAMLVDEAGVKKAEAYFIKHGAAATFFGRLIPAVRQLISLPAGLAKMPMLPFLLYTSLGAGIWCSVLAALGYFLYSQKELLASIEEGLKIGGVVLGVLFVGYLVYRGLKKKKPDSASLGAATDNDASGNPVAGGSSTDSTQTGSASQTSTSSEGSKDQSSH